MLRFRKTTINPHFITRNYLIITFFYEFITEIIYTVRRGLKNTLYFIFTHTLRDIFAFSTHSLQLSHSRISRWFREIAQRIRPRFYSLTPNMEGFSATIRSPASVNVTKNSPLPLHRCLQNFTRRIEISPDVSTGKVWTARSAFRPLLASYASAKVEVFYLVRLCAPPASLDANDASICVCVICYIICVAQ